MDFKEWRTLVILIGALGGLAWWAQADSRQAQRQDPFRPAGDEPFNESRPSLPIVARTLQVGGNQVQIIDIPSMLNSRLALAETQRCYVWRDLEFKTSSITLPAGRRDDTTPSAAVQPRALRPLRVAVSALRHHRQRKSPEQHTSFGADFE